MHIRKVKFCDAQSMLNIYAPYITDSAVSFEIEVPSLAEFESRIVKNSEFYPWLVAESEGQLIGYAYASRHKERAAYVWSVDVSVYVANLQHRSGVGRKLYEALLNDLRERGFYNAFAGITLPNQASVGFHESMGFKPLGIYQQVGFKLGYWYDVGIWQLQLKQADALIAPSAIRASNLF